MSTAILFRISWKVLKNLPAILLFKWYAFIWLFIGYIWGVIALTDHLEHLYDYGHRVSAVFPVVTAVVGAVAGVIALVWLIVSIVDRDIVDGTTRRTRDERHARA